MAGAPAPVNPQDLTNGTGSQHWAVMAQPPPRPDKAREARLAEALRENLRKRKAQARENTAVPPAKD